ncbi:hypothetical protein ABIE33_006897 [Ensifer sp. 4252]
MAGAGRLCLGSSWRLSSVLGLRTLSTNFPLCSCASASKSTGPAQLGSPSAGLLEHSPVSGCWPRFRWTNWSLRSAFSRWLPPARPLWRRPSVRITKRTRRRLVHGRYRNRHGHRRPTSRLALLARQGTGVAGNGRPLLPRRGGHVACRVSYRWPPRLRPTTCGPLSDAAGTAWKCCFQARASSYRWSWSSSCRSELCDRQWIVSYRALSEEQGALPLVRGLYRCNFELKPVRGVDLKIGLGVAWNKEDPSASRDDFIDIPGSLARPGG